jgi:hypothetical protein
MPRTQAGARRKCGFRSLSAVTLFVTASAAAQVTPIAPFLGEMKEDYTSFPINWYHSGPMSIFDGEATLTSTSGWLWIFNATTSPFGLGGSSGNGFAQPYSGDVAFGHNTATGQAVIAFASPVSEFGGYWSHATGGDNRFEVTFKDSSGAVIDFVTHTVQDPTGNLHWFGWQSATPIASIEIGGRYPVNDFLQASTGPGCYANCDGSTVEPILNVEDFTCFIGEFAAAQLMPHEQQLNHYANCDGSTTPPVLNVEDFTCFISEFALGCG